MRCVCVSAVGRGAGALGACACAAGGAGLPACGEERGSPLCVLVQRGKGCALLVRAKGAGGGIHRELGVVFCVSVCTCHKDEDLQFVCMHTVRGRRCAR